MYTLDVCNLDSAPSVPRRWPSMKKRRIENEKKRETRKKTRRRTKRRRNAEGEKVDASLDSRLLDVPGGKEGELKGGGEARIERTRGKAKAKKCVCVEPRRKHDTAGPDLGGRGRRYP